MSVALPTAIVVTTLLVLIFLGCPIFVSLGMSGAIGILLMRGWAGISQAPLAMFGQLESFTLVAVPLFILMGEALFHTGIGGDLYGALSKWLRGLPGGLAVASIYACAIFGAMCGVSIAGVATIGVMAVPEMRKRGYETSFAAGSVTAAGALAMLIPPSLLFILYGELARESVGKLFIGGIIPGIILATMMSIYVIVRVIRNPSLAPKEMGGVTWREKFGSLTKVWPAVVLIALVLGTIYTGVCTPTESAAIGSAGAFIIAAVVYRAINVKSTREILRATLRTTGAICAILACAMIFSQFLNLVRIPDAIAAWAVSMEIPRYGVVIILMLFLILLGMFIDGASMVIVTTPIVLPAILALGFDSLWYGVVLLINLEMAVITPPVGLNLYTMKSVLPELDIGDIIRGTMPYVAIEVLCLLIFIFFPKLTLWLPSTMG